MASKPEAILGISPGTRQVGIAIMLNGELIDWRLKIYPEKWSKEKLEKMLSHIGTFLCTHMITVIACKLPHDSRSSKELNRFIEGIQKIAGEYKIEFQSYAMNELKGSLNNRSELIKYTTNNSPELVPIFKKEEKHNNGYYLKLFEAVAAGMRCIKK